MANHHAREWDMHSLDFLTWPVVVPLSVAAWPIWPWFNALWSFAPTPTALYMAVSAIFMLFQMSDKLGWLDRFKKPPNKLEN